MPTGTEVLNKMNQRPYKESIEYIHNFANEQYFLFLETPTILGFNDYGRYLTPLEKDRLGRRIQNLLEVFEGEILDFSRNSIKAKVTLIWVTSDINFNALYSGEKISIFYEENDEDELVRIILKPWTSILHTFRREHEPLL